jgi:hypothetical protein
MPPSIDTKWTASVPDAAIASFVEASSMIARSHAVRPTLLKSQHGRYRVLPFLDPFMESTFREDPETLQYMRELENHQLPKEGSWRPVSPSELPFDQSLCAYAAISEASKAISKLIDRWRAARGQTSVAGGQSLDPIGYMRSETALRVAAQYKEDLSPLMWSMTSSILHDPQVAEKDNREVEKHVARLARLSSELHNEYEQDLSLEIPFHAFQTGSSFARTPEETVEWLKRDRRKQAEWTVGGSGPSHGRDTSAVTRYNAETIRRGARREPNEPTEEFVKSVTACLRGKQISRPSRAASGRSIPSSNIADDIIEVWGVPATAHTTELPRKAISESKARKISTRSSKTRSVRGFAVDVRRPRFPLNVTEQAEEPEGQKASESTQEEQNVLAERPAEATTKRKETHLANHDEVRALAPGCSVDKEGNFNMKIYKMGEPPT